MILSLLAAGLMMAAPTPMAAAPKPAPAASTPIVNGQALPKPSISPKVENSCSIVTPGADPKAPPTYTPIPGYRVLGGPAQLTLPKSDKPIAAISCRRDTIVPGDGDGRVLIFLRKPLMLSDGTREGVLLMKDGKYSFSMIRGTITDAERAAIGARLNIMQANFQAMIAAQKAKQGAAPAPAAPAKK